MDTLKGPTVSENLENALSTLPLRNLSEEELNKVRAILSLKLAEVDSACNRRKHIKTHFRPKSNEAK